MWLRFVCLIFPVCAWAEDYNISREAALADYQINREEMSVAAGVMKVLSGDFSMSDCQMGYLLVKAGHYEYSEEVFTACAEAGYPGAMTWLSYSFKNGLGVPKDLEKMAYWDKRAADAGDHVGMYNYGIDLLQGRGVSKDVAAGQEWISRAADGGYDDARKLRDNNFVLPAHF